jgi:hypothetical protein
MLTIRNQQLDALRHETVRELGERIHSHLREHHSSVVAVYEDDVLEKMVRGGIARARRHAVVLESNIVFFVSLMFEFAPNFDEHPQIRKILSNELLSPDENIKRFADEVSEYDWTEIEQNKNESAWQC